MQEVVVPTYVHIYLKIDTYIESVNSYLHIYVANCDLQVKKKINTLYITIYSLQSNLKPRCINQYPQNEIVITACLTFPCQV